MMLLAQHLQTWVQRQACQHVDAHAGAHRASSPHSSSQRGTRAAGLTGAGGLKWLGIFL